MRVMRATISPRRKLAFLTVPIASIALLCSVLAMSPAAAVSPITPANRPTPLPGQVNGVVASNQLVRPSLTCIAARAAGPSLMRVFAMAREANVSLGADECYRSLSEEVSLANQANQPGNNPAC